MDFNFSGKRALVTGAGKGIGKGVTLKLVELGAEVVAVSRTKSDLDALAKVSPKIKTICLDIGNWDDTHAALKRIGPIDFLVNNAAIMPVKVLESWSKREVDELFDINVKAIINITQLIANDMKERGQGGSIINVSSIAGINVIPGFGVYSATKGAVNLLTLSMAVEYGPHNIRVNAINPTVVKTRLTEDVGFFDPNNATANSLKSRTPLRKFAVVDEIVKPIIFLLSDNAAMITGLIMPIDGGLHNRFD